MLHQATAHTPDQPYMQDIICVSVGTFTAYASQHAPTKLNRDAAAACPQNMLHLSSAKFTSSVKSIRPHCQTVYKLPLSNMLCIQKWNIVQCDWSDSSPKIAWRRNSWTQHLSVNSNSGESELVSFVCLFYCIHVLYSITPCISWQTYYIVFIFCSLMEFRCIVS